MDELKDMVRGLMEKVSALENRETACQTSTQLRIEAAHHRLNQHDEGLKSVDERQDKLEQALQKLQVAYGILVFIGGAFGLSIIALIWALVTGQAQIQFK